MRHLKCSICDKHFSTLQGLELHQDMHRGRYPYHCQFCVKGCLSTVDAIPITASTVARAVSPPWMLSLSLPVLWQGLSPPWTLSLSLPVLWQGLSLHHRRYHCQFCGKGCLSTTNLRRHLVKHTGVRDHKCTLCSKEFSCPWTLRRHINTHKNG